MSIVKATNALNLVTDFVNEVKALIKFHQQLKQGNIAKASEFYAEFKRYSDITEKKVAAQLAEAKELFREQDRIVTEMRIALN